MTDRQQYETDIIQMMYDICRPKSAPRLSDADVTNEHLAIARFKLARHVFEESLQAILPLTSLRADRIKDILDMLEDASPDPKVWEDDIARAMKL